MGKNLVAYFSATGSTAEVAEVIADVIKGDLHEIKPAVRYSKKDLDWRNKLSRSTKEMHDEFSRPQINKLNINTNEYTTIFIGFPIWWYTAPKIINTFLESYDFSCKTIVLFATSRGSDFGNTVIGLKGCLKEDTEIIEGEVFKGRPTAEMISKWIEDLCIELNGKKST